AALALRLRCQVALHGVVDGVAEGAAQVIEGEPPGSAAAAAQEALALQPAQLGEQRPGGADRAVPRLPADALQQRRRSAAATLEQGGRGELTERRQQAEVDVRLRRQRS